MDLLITILSVYLALAIALACGLGVFLLTRRELRRLSRELESLRELSSMSVPAAGSAPINLHRRSQILRLDRMGEKAETIAAMVGAPQAEVDLALKVAKLPLQLFQPGT